MVDARLSSVDVHREIDSTCDRFETAWCEYLEDRDQHDEPRLEDYLDGLTDPSNEMLFAELLKVELSYLRRLGTLPLPDRYFQRFPTVAKRTIERAFARARDGDSTANSEIDAHDGTPTAIGGYRIVEVIGRGGFGTVYRGRDDILNRDVAIKVSNPSSAPSGQAVSAFISEGRALARLRHPHIVTIYKVGTTSAGQSYIATELIEGTDLATAIKRRHVDCRQAARLIATIAEALHYCHTKGLIHRDIKPANILLDSAWRPYLADFGMALHGAENHWFNATEGGTLAYMSPEQARCEGHLVDCRSDVFSLGVVFYELLTGHRPFTGETWQETLERLTTVDPHPPRTLNEGIAPALEQVCMKAMAKRAADRYETAQQMAGDISDFLDGEVSATAGVCNATATDLPVRIVPKGLRSFDATDADFFLHLVPGPRDRTGLPDSISFWKQRIEGSSGASLRVGLLYGPSGSGKSSLIKAGLLPKLSQVVCPISVEASLSSTEQNLLDELRKRFPEIPRDTTLPVALQTLRTAGFLRVGSKVLIVLDQFEQWLHGAAARDENSQLALALRQCDGERIQCLILIRDDFWTPVSRFMASLEAPIVDGQNARAAEFFDPRHARRVLTAFGQAYHCLPSDPARVSERQREFLEKAVDGMARDDRITPVQISLFCELAKEKPWDPATYRAFGGAEGAGVLFLERTFAAQTAPAQHRAHLSAALAVLESLLPERHFDLKGPVRTRDELLKVSGYDNAPDRFRELMQILDQRLRLISPSGCDDAVEGLQSSGRQPTATRYQLTHDYLIPSLRTWLQNKRLETRQGRALALIEERERHWDSQHPNRYLPSLLDYCQLRLWTRPDSWTTKQRSMMSVAARHHFLRLLVVGCLLTFAVVQITAIRLRATREAQVDGVIHALKTAELKQLPVVWERLASSWQFAEPRLKALSLNPNLEVRERFRAALALLRFSQEPGLDKRVLAQVVPLLNHQLIRANAEDIDVICQSIGKYHSQISEGLWATLSTSTEPPHIFCAASALMRFCPFDPRWNEAGVRVARELSLLCVPDPQWLQSLEHGKHLLLPELIRIFSDPAASPRQHLRALDAVLALGNADDLCKLLLASNDTEAADIISLLIDDPETARIELQRAARRDPAYDRSGDLRHDLVAVALAKLGRYEYCWQLLKDNEGDLTTANRLIHQLARHDCDPRTIAQRLSESLQESSPRMSALLCQALGELSTASALEQFQRLESQLWSRLEDTKTDPALHGSIDWLLSRWRGRAELDKFYARVRRPLEETIADDDRWYSNNQGQKMIVLTAGSFTIGAPESEISRGRRGDEKQHPMTINRRFAISAFEVTKSQYLRFNPHHTYEDGEFEQVSWDDQCPVTGISWHHAAKYCNWLSQQAGIPQNEWCYRETGIGDTMELIPGYLSKLGYRLPTEAEWEFSCRADGADSWTFGHDPLLLGYYAWFEGNLRTKEVRSEPIGQLKPNLFGLFDIHGNVWEWTCDAYYENAHDGTQREPKLVDLEDTQPAEERVRRGGSFQAGIPATRSSNRSTSAPGKINRINGIRTARTLSTNSP